MTEKFKILAKYIKDLSSETPDIETFLFVKDNILYFKKIVKPTPEELKKHKEFLKKDLKKNFFN